MSLRSALIANQRALIAMSAPRLGEISDVLSDLRDEIERKLKFMSKPGFELQKLGSVYLQLDQAIKIATHKLPGAVARELASQSKTMSKKSVENLRKIVEEGTRRFGTVSESLRLPQASVVLDVQKTVMHRHKASAVRYGGRVGQLIRRQMAMGLVRGESVDEMARKISTASGRSKIADGVADISMNDALRLVRTELNNSYALTEIKGIKSLNEERDDSDPPWMKMWDATLDMRTCDDCRWLNGKIVPVDALFPRFLIPGPPLHPNDRCCLTPWRQGWPRNYLTEGL